jgi:hypothetical protein
MRKIALILMLGLVGACGADGPPSVPGGSPIANEVY